MTNLSLFCHSFSPVYVLYYAYIYICISCLKVAYCLVVTLSRSTLKIIIWNDCVLCRGHRTKTGKKLFSI